MSEDTGSSQDANKQAGGEQGGNGGDGAQDKQNANAGGANDQGGKQDQGNKQEQGKGEQDKGGGDKSDQNADKQTGDYGLTLPDGSILDKEAVTRVTDTAKRFGLSKEHASELLSFGEAEVKRFKDGKETEFKQLVTKAWPGAIQADPEIGGGNFNASKEFADAAITRFATPEFKKALNDTGFGNHPELVRVFSRIGKAMRQDKFETQGGGNSASKRPIEDVLFGDPPKA